MELANKCRCQPTDVGQPLRRNRCRVHTKRRYACEATGCENYRPNRIKMFATDWPRCVCGAIAQDHN